MSKLSATPDQPDPDDQWLRLLRDRLDYGHVRQEDIVSLWSPATGTWRGLRTALEFLGRKGPFAPPAFVSDFLGRYAVAVGARTMLDPFATSPTYSGGLAAEAPQQSRSRRARCWSTP